MGRVLVIEDDDRIGRLVARSLESGGLSTERAATGPAGLDTALRREFDLIVLDLMLPGMDGRQVLRRLIEERPEQRVLVLSAVPEFDTRVAVLEAGAAAVLGKPFAVAELVARVRSRLRSAAPGAAARNLRAGPVRLDLLDRPDRIETVRHVGYAYSSD